MLSSRIRLLSFAVLYFSGGSFGRSSDVTSASQILWEREKNGKRASKALVRVARVPRGRHEGWLHPIEDEIAEEFA